MTQYARTQILSAFAAVICAFITIGISVAVLLLSPIVKRWMHLDTLQDRDDLAGQKELAEPIAPGLRPQDETRPDGAPKRI